jgi:streptogrisin C
MIGLRYTHGVRTMIVVTTLVSAALVQPAAGVYQRGASANLEVDQVAPPAEPAVDESESLALDQDLAAIATESGVTLEKATEQYSLAESLAEVAVAIAEKRPAQFLGSEVAPEFYPGPAVFIKGPSDVELETIALRGGVHIVDNRTFALAELEDNTARIHRELAKLGFRDISTNFDIENGTQIDAAVAQVDSLPSDPTEILGALPADVREFTRLSVVDEPGLDLEAFGGMAMRDDGVRECTGGWSVRNLTTDETGVTTAGHCVGINEINHPGAGGIHDKVGPGDQHRGEWGDIEWHPFDVAEPDDFYADATMIRDVTGVRARASISVDNFVCYYGRFSDDRDCSLQVSDASFACTNSGVFNNRLVELDDDGVAIPGDSGDPVYFDNTAWGSIKGTCAPRGWLTFSVADLYDEALNVQVRR